MKSGVNPSGTKKLVKFYKSKLAKDALERIAELVILNRKPSKPLSL